MSRVLVDSGINWIGKIPSDWKCTKIKRVENLINGYSFQSDKYSDSGYFIVRITNVDDGVLNKKDPKYYPYEFKQKFESAILEKNDILMSLTGNVGLVGLVNDEILPAALNQRVGSLRKISEDIVQKYVYYLFQTKQFETEAILNSVGTAQLNMSTNWLKELRICVPSPEEQTKIANYLDEKCSKIDQVIEDNNKEIKLLEEYKKSVIKDYVVHGVNKKTFKRVELDIIDKLPEKWTIGKLKNYLNIYNGKDCEKNLDSTYIPVYGSGGIFGYTSDYLYDGESLLLGRKGTIDKPILVKGKFWTVDTMFYTVPKIDCNLKYIYYYMSVLNWDKYVFGTALPSMTQSILNDIKIPFISKNEQDEIVNLLDKICEKIDKTITYRKKIIEKLEEYMKSLIYEVVTGKKEV